MTGRDLCHSLYWLLDTVHVYPSRIMVSAFLTLRRTTMVVMETFTLLGDISHKVFLIIDMQIQQKLFEYCITPLLIHMTLFLSSKRNSKTNVCCHERPGPRDPSVDVDVSVCVQWSVQSWKFSINMHSTYSYTKGWRKIYTELHSSSTCIVCCWSWRVCICVLLIYLSITVISDCKMSASISPTCDNCQWLWY